jgi:hypothetical protein
MQMFILFILKMKLIMKFVLFMILTSLAAQFQLPYHANLDTKSQEFFQKIVFQVDSVKINFKNNRLVQIFEKDRCTFSFSSFQCVFPYVIQENPSIDKELEMFEATPTSSLSYFNFFPTDYMNRFVILLTFKLNNEYGLLKDVENVDDLPYSVADNILTLLVSLNSRRDVASDLISLVNHLKQFIPVYYELLIDPNQIFNVAILGSSLVIADETLADVDEFDCSLNGFTYSVAMCLHQHHGLVNSVNFDTKVDNQTWAVFKLKYAFLQVFITLAGNINVLNLFKIHKENTTLKVLKNDIYEDFEKIYKKIVFYKHGILFDSKIVSDCYYCTSYTDKDNTRNFVTHLFTDTVGHNSINSFDYQEMRKGIDSNKMDISEYWIKFRYNFNSMKQLDIRLKNPLEDYGTITKSLFTTIYFSHNLSTESRKYFNSVYFQKGGVKLAFTKVKYIPRWFRCDKPISTECYLPYEETKDFKFVNANFYNNYYNTRSSILLTFKLIGHEHTKKYKKSKSGIFSKNRLPYVVDGNYLTVFIGVNTDNKLAELIRFANGLKAYVPTYNRTVLEPTYIYTLTLTKSLLILSDTQVILPIDNNISKFVKNRCSVKGIEIYYSLCLSIHMLKQIRILARLSEDKALVEFKFKCKTSVQLLINSTSNELSDIRHNFYESRKEEKYFKDYTILSAFRNSEFYKNATQNLNLVVFTTAGILLDIKSDTSLTQSKDCNTYQSMQGYTCFIHYKKEEEYPSCVDEIIIYEQDTYYSITLLYLPTKLHNISLRLKKPDLLSTVITRREYLERLLYLSISLKKFITSSKFNIRLINLSNGDQNSYIHINRHSFALGIYNSYGLSDEECRLVNYNPINKLSLLKKQVKQVELLRVDDEESYLRGFQVEIIKGKITPLSLPDFKVNKNDFYWFIKLFGEENIYFIKDRKTLKNRFK